MEDLSNIINDPLVRTTSTKTDWSLKLPQKKRRKEMEREIRK